jgi:hypothetical protein
VILGDSEKLPVLTELRCYDKALEVKLDDCDEQKQQTEKLGKNPNQRRHAYDKGSFQGA